MFKNKYLKKYFFIFIFLLACGTSVVLSAEEESWCRFWGSEDGESFIYGSIRLGDYTDLDYWEKTFFSSAETVGANPEKYMITYEQVRPNNGYIVCLDQNGNKIDCMMTVEQINYDWFLDNLKNGNTKAPEVCKTWYGLVQGKSFVD
jgi:hypothetical protein